jgi:hypothetical protein
VLPEGAAGLPRRLRELVLGRRRPDDPARPDTLKAPVRGVPAGKA